jgi:hypothetical protein
MVLVLLAALEAEAPMTHLVVLGLLGKDLLEATGISRY